jgi:hypothetical protein
MVPAGYDVLDPLFGSSIYLPGLVNGVQFFDVIGVPLETFPFPSIGRRFTGNADTILYRGALSDASPTASIQMMAMQMRTVGPYDYYFTLSTTTASTGSITVEFGPEPHLDSRFSWNAQIYLDVRTGGVDGLIVHSFDIPLTTVGTWNHMAPPGAVLIEGINYKLNGVDDAGDFFPKPFVATGAGSTISFAVATPEPASVVFLTAGLMGAVLPFGRKRQGT